MDSRFHGNDKIEAFSREWQNREITDKKLDSRLHENDKIEAFSREWQNENIGFPFPREWQNENIRFPFSREWQNENIGFPFSREWQNENIGFPFILEWQNENTGLPFFSLSQGQEWKNRGFFSNLNKHNCERSHLDFELIQKGTFKDPYLYGCYFIQDPRGDSYCGNGRHTLPSCP